VSTHVAEERIVSSTIQSPAIPIERELLRLLCLVAEHDRSAFADLYDVLAQPLQQSLRATFPSAIYAEAITSATFVEVWLQARYHTDVDTDVGAWINLIAARRAADRRYINAGGQVLHLSTVDAEGQLRLAAVADSYDHNTRVALKNLLDPSAHIPV
jgi:DNA-directed RNA polymerase specialized sigma24 family protein